MAYAGRTPTTGFRSVPTKDTFSGDGSTTAFTLSLSTRTNDVEVFVENVQQEPTTAYSISGTTLTFTSAPVSGTNNIYVIHRGELVSNGVHTPGADLQAVNATITGDLTVSGTTITMDSASVQTVDLGDNDKIRLGDADDAQIYHDGTNTIINNDTGNIGITGSNVGIGTSSPSVALEVNGGDVFQQMIIRRGTSGTSDPILTFQRGDGTSTGHIGGASGDSLQFRTGSGTGTERMRITSSGNVGIGTNSPTNILHVNSGTSNTNALFESTDAGVNIFLKDNTARSMIGQDGGDLLIYADVDNTGAGGTIRFYPNNPASEAMRIDSNGNLLVGGTQASAASSNASNSASISSSGAIEGSKSGATVVSLNRTENDTVNREYVRFYRVGSSNLAGTITATKTATSYNTTSDYRLKENVVDMTGAIDRVKALNPSQFNFISDPDRTVDGFLAHEVSDVVPEAVIGTKDAMQTEEYEVTPAVLDEDGNVVTEAVMGTREVPDYQGIDQSKLVPLLTGALQEAIAEIEALKERVTALEAN